MCDKYRKGDGIARQGLGPAQVGNPDLRVMPTLQSAFGFAFHCSSSWQNRRTQPGLGFYQSRARGGKNIHCITRSSEPMG